MLFIKMESKLLRNMSMFVCLDLLIVIGERRHTTGMGECRQDKKKQQSRRAYKSVAIHGRMLFFVCVCICVVVVVVVVVCYMICS